SRCYAYSRDREALLLPLAPFCTNARSRRSEVTYRTRTSWRTRRRDNLLELPERERRRRLRLWTLLATTIIQFDLSLARDDFNAHASRVSGHGGGARPRSQGRLRRRRSRSLRSKLRWEGKKCK